MVNWIVKYVLGRLNENSTLVGIVLAVSSALHITFTAAQTDASVYWLLATIGLIKAFLPDKFFAAK